MLHNNVQPGSPADWLRHARSDLELSRSRNSDDILLETLCFHTQQAVEKSLKAVLIYVNVEFPKTHNIKTLVELLTADIKLDDDIKDIVILTDYAVTSRYPVEIEPITEDEYENAVKLAGITVKWAERIISNKN